jgi:hypothetical protein
MTMMFGCLEGVEAAMADWVRRGVNNVKREVSSRLFIRVR